MHVAYETKEYFARFNYYYYYYYYCSTSLCWALPLPEILMAGYLHPFDFCPAAVSYNS
jgi:hypothetical protein